MITSTLNTLTIFPNPKPTNPHPNPEKLWSSHPGRYLKTLTCWIQTRALDSVLTLILYWRREQFQDMFIVHFFILTVQVGQKTNISRSQRFRVPLPAPFPELWQRHMDHKKQWRRSVAEQKHKDRNAGLQPAVVTARCVFVVIGFCLLQMSQRHLRWEPSQHHQHWQPRKEGPVFYSVC